MGESGTSVASVASIVAGSASNTGNCASYRGSFGFWLLCKSGLNIQLDWDPAIWSSTPNLAIVKIVFFRYSTRDRRDKNTILGFSAGD